MSNTTTQPEFLIRFPKQQPPQTIVLEQPCLKGCPPKYSAGCDLGTSCGDFYLNPLCNYVGITGGPGSCIVYDEQWGGCGTCIGCDQSCPPSGYCPWNGNLPYY